MRTARLQGGRSRHTIARDQSVDTVALEIPAGLNVLGRWQNALPTSATFPFGLRRADIRRGEERFEVFCTPCHGQVGDGDGMIVKRGFTRPPTYHSARLRSAA